VNQPERYLNGDEDSFRKLLGCDCSELIVATVDDRPIAFIAFSKRTVFRYPRPIVEVEELYVQVDFRRKGIALELMNRAHSWAKEQYAYYIFLASDSLRTDAHEFYASLGYDQYGKHYRLRM